MSGFAPMSVNILHCTKRVPGHLALQLFIQPPFSGVRTEMAGYLKLVAKQTIISSPTLNQNDASRTALQRNAACE